MSSVVMLKTESEMSCSVSGMTALNRILSLPLSDIVKHVQLFTIHNCTCAQVSEVDMTGAVLRSFVDVKWPWRLSLDSEGHLLVADTEKHHILLLNSQLDLQRVLIDRNSQVDLQWPRRLYCDEHASKLYVIHRSSSRIFDSSRFLSLFNVR